MTSTNNSLNIPQTDGQLLIGSTGNAPVAATITGSGGITVTPGAGTLNIDGSGSAFTWNLAAFNTTMLPNNGYAVTSAPGNLTFTMPAFMACSVGDVIRVASWTNLRTFSILINPRQSISINGNVVANSLTSPTTFSGSAIEIVCTSRGDVPALNDQFVVTSYVGTFAHT